MFTGMFPILSSPDLPRLQRTALWFYAESCDQAVDRLRVAGAAIVDEPSDTDWGERVARVLDPDGNVLHIGQAGPSA